MKQELKVLAAGLALFGVYLPLALWGGGGYVPPPRPTGKAVEMMLKFEFDEPDRYVARSYVFRPAWFPDTSQISVYEGMTPLPRENLGFTTDVGVYVIRLKTSDGSDPRTNGRQYWMVLQEPTDDLVTRSPGVAPNLLNDVPG